MGLKYYKVGEVFDTPIGRVRVVEDFAWPTVFLCGSCAFYLTRFCKLYECISLERPDFKSVHFELIDDKNCDKWN